MLTKNLNSVYVKKEFKLGWFMLKKNLNWVYVKK